MSIAIKKLNKNTKKNDLFLKLDPPLATEIIIDLKHSHQIEVSDVLRQLKVSDEVKEQFFNYFFDGLTPANAKRHHENKFLVLDDATMHLANASKNPTQRQVYGLYEIWKNNNLGSPFNPLEKLNEKLKLYKDAGTDVHIEFGDKWAVLIVTPIMKRIHNLPNASEIIFCDTTDSNESTNCTFTVLLTATKSGAIPVASLIHQDQTTESYEIAFSLLRNCFPLCFGGKEHPNIFMTDDSSMEKSALKKVWPAATQLLCLFRVAQAEWHWIHSAKIIPEEKRQEMMQCFHKVMYATEDHELNEAISDLIIKGSPYPEYQKRFTNFMERRKEWLSFERQQLLTRGHATNNYSEATIRILKDVVLCRTKAFNVIALTDFIVSIWNDYLSLKLLEYANNKMQNDPLYISLTKRSNDMSLNKCRRINEYDYRVPRKNNVGEYLVDVKYGICSCPPGMNGAFCKHLLFLSKELKINLLNAPLLNTEDCHMLAFIATGQRYPKNFFEPFNEEADETLSSLEITEIQNVSSFPNSRPKQMATQLEKDFLLSEFRRMLEVPLSYETVSKLNNSFKNLTGKNIEKALKIIPLALSAKKTIGKKY